MYVYVGVLYTYGCLKKRNQKQYSKLIVIFTREQNLLKKKLITIDIESR